MVLTSLNGAVDRALYVTSGLPSKTIADVICMKPSNIGC